VIEDVEDLIRAAAATAILPRFRRLAAADVAEKAPDEWVTAADLEAERLLAVGLTALLPGSAVVGEEAVAADPALLGHVGDAGAVWLVDPLDGTRNFAAGRGPFAVMVALLRGGTACAAWLLDPLTGTCATAEAGSGAFLGGVRVRTGTDCPPPAALSGAVFTRFLPPDLRARVEPRTAALGQILPGSGCAGHEYPAVAGGAQHFALFWRTLPWDHAPGVLFAQEAGAVARRLDGSTYVATDGRPGLLLAQNEAVWRQVHAALLTEPPPER
jgi:fructose-1,6-bisphosphatase/inositol monophosphatase family enzyme